MKIEIDLSVEQMKDLEEDLRGFIKGLSEEQHTAIIQNFLQAQFDELFYEKKDCGYWGNSSSFVLSDLGKTIVDGLKESVRKAITEDLIADANLQKAIQDTVEQTRNHLTDYVQEGIVKYTINEIFCDKNRVMDIVYQNFRNRN
jgi:uncharacterized membrane-anchored protein YjiN (DUF445 family)